MNTPKRLPTIGQTASRPSQWITSKPGQSWDMQTMSDSEETANADPAMSSARTGVATPPVQPAIEVIGIGRRDPKTDGWLIRDVSFAVNSGERLGILGPSGAGKTVLLRALAILDPLDAGTILWKGQSVRGDAVPAFRKQVIYLHQRPSLFEGSVEENLDTRSRSRRTVATNLIEHEPAIFWRQSAEMPLFSTSRAVTSRAAKPRSLPSCGRFSSIHPCFCSMNRRPHSTAQLLTTSRR